MNFQASYYRARILAIREVLSRYTGRKEKLTPEELLKYGYIHEDIREEIEQEIADTEVSNAPLSFTELCSFNTWFAMHPHKICGEELLTTSLEFPITIKASKEQIIQTITPPTTNARIRLAKARAKAKLKLLNLIAL